MLSFQAPLPGKETPSYSADDHDPNDTSCISEFEVSVVCEHPVIELQAALLLSLPFHNDSSNKDNNTYDQYI
jgi:hypothetical protein